jgi:hypothetical protein
MTCLNLNFMLQLRMFTEAAFATKYQISLRTSQYLSESNQSIVPVLSALY